MNPFTESTVASPLHEKSCFRFASSPLAPRARARHSLARLALGVLTGVAMPGMAVAVDVNAATTEQLRDVRGIGPKTAQIIVEERSRGGPYESFSDLSDRVKGIGPKKAAALQASGLKVGAAARGKVSDAALSAPGVANVPVVRQGTTRLVRPAGK